MVLVGIGKCDLEGFLNMDDLAGTFQPCDSANSHMKAHVIGLSCSDIDSWKYLPEMKV